MKADNNAFIGGSIWAPFGTSSFRWLWTAGACANMGLWMQSIGAAWLMAQQSASPSLIAGVQVAISLPGFLLSLPAGTLADRWDRRKLLMGVHLFLVLVAGGLCLMEGLAGVGPLTLLVCTFLIGSGMAVAGPAIQSVIADIVPAQHLPQAVTLSGISFNTARALGPSLAGLILVASGSVTVFAVVALLFCAMLPAAARVSAPGRAEEGPIEPLWNSMRAALRYARHSQPVLDPLMRAGLFGIFGAALWALLPLIAKLHSTDPGAFGLLASCLGGGAIAAGFFLPTVSRWIGVNRLVGFSGVLFAVSTTAATVTPLWAAAAFMVLTGAAWAWTLNTLYSAMQTSLPRWIRGRAVALYILVAQGSVALGSLAWGAVAEHLSVTQTLMIAGLGAAIGALVSASLRPLRLGGTADTTLAAATRAALPDAAPSDGPIAIEVEYRIDAEDVEEFRRLAEAVGRARRRDGAVFWRLYRDMSDPGCWRERFIVESWAEYRRLHGRQTQTDLEFETQLWSLHRLPERVTRYSVADH